MKTITALFLSLCFVFGPCAAGPVQQVMLALVTGSTPPPTYAFVENFETLVTGYENSGWTTANTAIPAATAAIMGVAALQGSQSLYAATGANRGANRARSETGEVWFYWQQYNITGVVDDAQFYGDNTVGNFQVNYEGGKIKLRIGGSQNIAASTFPLDQKVHVWVRFKPGASDASGDLYYSTDGVRGSPKCTLSGIAYATEANHPEWMSRSTYAVIWDRIIINPTEIGDNP